MKILFLAPQPFFQERGTPIAVRLALEVLAARQGKEVHLLTYHEGQNVQIPGVTIFRIPAPWGITGVGPGISLKKLVCDFVFLFSALKLVWQARSNQYQLVHAVEESVFVAWLIKLIWGLPYIYDMDSSLALQLTEKWEWFRPLRALLEFFERHATRGSIAVVPVCDSLAAIAERHGSKETLILRDISLLDQKASAEAAPNLRREAGLSQNDLVVLYIGNLESYQGIDLLLESFAIIAPKAAQAQLVIIGGTPAHLEKYQLKAKALGCQNQVHFLGPKPVQQLKPLLSQADVLVSPRTLGNNTPMKIYSYLHSGKVTVATNLPTHSQVLNNQVAVLTAPEPKAFADGLLSVLSDANLRERLGRAAFQLAEEKYTYKIFSRELNGLYDRLSVKLADSNYR